MGIHSIDIPDPFAAGLPRIAGDGVALREISERDVPALFRIFSHPEVMRYWSTPPLRSISEAEEYWKRIESGWRERTLFQWGITRAGSDDVIGTTTLYRVDAVHGRAELGYALDRAWWGHGIASRAVGAVIGFAFSTLRLTRLEADADPRNERSIRLLSRQGFVREGYLRERYCVAGEWQDSVLMGLLQREWRMP